MQRSKVIGNVLLITGVVSIALSLLFQERQQVLLSGMGVVLTVSGAVIIIRNRDR
jgi:hypothetical protein